MMTKAASATPSPQNLIDAILTGTPDAIFAKDLKGRYLLLNQAGAAIVGKSEADVLGKDDTFIFPLSEARVVRTADREIMEAGETRIFEESVTAASGRITSFLSIKGPIRNEKGAVIGLFGIARDITERKRTEASLANMQKLESLGTLAGGIAHDFNNILTVILGNLSMLREDSTIEGEAKELLAEAQHACAIAKNLSHQLLTFSRGGSPVTTVMDLRSMLPPAVGFAARGSNAHCIFDFPESPLAAKIDEDQIAQVIQNLVINATQAMPQGGSITVRAAAVTLGAGELASLAAGRYARVSVEDQGPGIPPENLARIFDPYFTTKTEGRGLGLSMCYSIMRKHGGHIGAESKPGAGAVFTLHLPAANAADIPLKNERLTLATGSGRVLIMDDDVLVAKVLGRMLDRLGYQTETVRDGSAALRAYAQAMKARKPYNAVIMDLTIPGGMGGKEAIGKLRALDPQAQVIVSSGYANDPTVSDSVAYGFSGVLTKPYLLEEVSGVLRRVIGSKPAR